jgi:cell division septation protein DedD
LGQKRAAQEFSYRADQESLADQIYSSMCVLYDAKDDEEAEGQEDEQLTETDAHEALAENLEPASQNAEEVSVEPAAPAKQYRAVLSGFPASLVQDAKNMVARLTKKGYPVELVEHTSINKNVTKKWYQVITKPYASREELEKIKPYLAKFGYVKEQSIKIV